MVHIEYNEIASLHHLPVANLKSAFWMAAGRAAAYLDFIIIGFKVFHIVAQLRRGIWQYPNQGTVVIPNKSLLAFDSGGNDLVKISVPSDQELHILLFQKQRMNQRLHTILRLTKLRDDPVSKKLTVNMFTVLSSPFSSQSLQQSKQSTSHYIQTLT